MIRSACCVLILLSLCVLGGCVGIPKGTEAVAPFQLDRYLGRWYEIARLDHHFEAGLDCVTATYSRRADGGVRVVNRGIDLDHGRDESGISEATGRAYFTDGPDTARFKVSFFGPFYAGYNVLRLDDDYDQAIIGGSNRGYLWILARRPQLPADETRRLVGQAAAMGFDTRALVYPRQGPACAPYRQDRVGTGRPDAATPADR